MKMNTKDKTTQNLLKVKFHCSNQTFTAEIAVSFTDPGNTPFSATVYSI